MYFRPTRFDLDVCISGGEGGYDYIVTHTNDVLVVAVNPTSIFNKLKETYIINTFSLPIVHLGCDYSQVRKGATTQLVMGGSTYTTEDIRKFCTLLTVATLRKEKFPSSPGYHPELDLIPLLIE